MVRKLRLERQGAMKHQGAVYHLVSRGNERERLFSCNENRSRRLEGLGNAIERQAKDFCGLLRSNHPCEREVGT